jgi:hypothetical protein
VRILSVRRLFWIWAALAVVGGAAGALTACDDTGPSPVGEHPDTPLDSGAEPEEDGAAADASEEGGDAEVDAAEDAGGDAADASDAGDAADADAGD